MPAWMASAILVAARISALVVVVPGLQNNWLPWRLRCGLVLVLAMPVLCVVAPLTQDIPITNLWVQLVREFSVGVSLAMVPAVLFMGLGFATESIQGMTGLGGMSTATNSSTMPDNVTGRFFYVVALTVFFASSGHRHVIQALLNSFHWLPPGSVVSFESTKQLLMEMFSQSFQLGVRCLAPIGISLAIGLLALAAINRVMPQFSYFAIGMSVQTTTLIASIVIFLGGIGLYLESSFENGVNNWQQRGATVLQNPQMTTTPIATPLGSEENREVDHE